MKVSSILFGKLTRRDMMIKLCREKHTTKVREGFDTVSYAMYIENFRLLKYLMIDGHDDYDWFSCDKNCIYAVMNNKWKPNNPHITCCWQNMMDQRIKPLGIDRRSFVLLEQNRHFQEVKKSLERYDEMYADKDTIERNIEYGRALGNLIGIKETFEVIKRDDQFAQTKLKVLIDEVIQIIGLELLKNRYFQMGKEDGICRFSYNFMDQLEDYENVDLEDLFKESVHDVVLLVERTYRISDRQLLIEAEQF